jgi:hypothetical protein
LGKDLARPTEISESESPLNEAGGSRDFLGAWAFRESAVLNVGLEWIFLETNPSNFTPTTGFPIKVSSVVSIESEGNMSCSEINESSSNKSGSRDL